MAVKRLLASLAVALIASTTGTAFGSVSSSLSSIANRYFINDSERKETYLPPWIKRVGYESLMIVLDVSGSMRGTKLREAKKAILNLLDRIEDTGMNVKVGLITYSSGERFLGWYEPKRFSKLKRIVLSLKAGGYTATGPAMELALSLMKDRESEIFNGGRQKCVSKVVINVTDGAWNVGEDPIRPSYKLWKAGVTVYTVPVLLKKSSHGWNSTQWESIVGGFVDLNGDGKPCNVRDISIINSLKTPIPRPCPEWDGNADSKPDTFYPVSKVSKLSSVLVDIYYDSLDRFYGSSVCLNNKTINKDTGIAVLTSYKPYDVETGRNWAGGAYYYFLRYDSKDKKEPYRFYSDSRHNYKLDSKDYEVKWLDGRELAIELLNGEGKIVKVVSDFDDAYPIVSLAKEARKGLGKVYFGMPNGKVYALSYYNLPLFGQRLFPYDLRVARKLALYVASGRLKVGLGDNLYGGNVAFERGGYGYYVYLSNRGFVHVFYLGKGNEKGLTRDAGELLLSYSPTSALPNVLKVLTNDDPSVHYFLVDGFVRYYPEVDALIGTVGWGKSREGSSVFCLKLKGYGKRLSIDTAGSWDYQINEYSTAGFVKVGNYVYVFAGPDKTPVEAKSSTAVSTKKPKFYVLNLKTGRLVGQYSLKGGKGFFGKVDQDSVLDVDGDGIPDYVFASVDYNGESGALVVIDVRNPESPSYWVVKSLKSPIVEAPIVGKCKGSYWIYFGTGTLYTVDDNYKTANYLFGLKVYVGANGVTLGKVGEVKQCSVGTEGWKVALDAATADYSSERSITSPFFVGEHTVGFLTTKFSKDGCSNEFKSRYWFLECDTGLSVSKGCDVDEGLNTVNLVAVQLTTGNLNVVTLTNAVLNGVVNEKGQTEWFNGVAPTSSPSVIRAVPEGVKVLYDEEVAN